MTKPFRAEQIEPARAWPLRSIHGRVTAYRIAGWAITAWIKRNAIRAA